MIYFYVYGVTLSLLSVGFYINESVNSPINHKAAKSFFKLVFSITGGWLLIAAVSASTQVLARDVSHSMIWLWILIVYLFPMFFFIGFQMTVYGMLDDK